MRWRRNHAYTPEGGPDTMTPSSVANVFRVVLLAWVAAASLNILAARAQSVAAPARSTAQLEQLVAPIALYPDALLSQTLMASTYPLEVVEAARWSQQNSNVTGQGLEEAMQRQSWDPSVKALTAIPQTLQMMNDRLSWTQELGDAFLAQQQDVLDAVQRLRARADANGQLKSNEHQQVAQVARPAQAAPSAPAGTVPQAIAPAGPIYTITPTDPEQYYVPIYDPVTAYGTWPYPDDAPFYWTPPGYLGGNALSFAAGAVTGAAIWGGVDWARNRVDVNVNNFNRFNRTNVGNTNWAHNPAHRGGVPYRDQGVAQRFSDPGKAAARDNYRGKADAGRRDLAKPGGVNKAQGAANRTQQGAANRTGGQGSAKTKVAGQGNAKAKSGGQAGQKGSAKQKAASKQGGAKQAASAKQGGKSKQASQSRPAQSKQHAQARQSHQRAAAPRSSAGRSAQARSPAASHRGGGGMQGRSAGMRGGGGGGRGGGRGRR
jgi:hypothetical protein